MDIEDLEITLEEEEALFPEGARETAMAGWIYAGYVHGDDGKQYRMECSTMVLKEAWGNIDVCIMAISSERGKVVQPPGSVYKIADFPKSFDTDWAIFPRGTLEVKRAKNRVTVDLGDFHLICWPDDKTWHVSMEGKERGIKAELVHTGIGGPRWFYDRKKPEAWTPHSINCGYCMSGTVEGTLTIGGRKVGIKGAGYRERYYAVDACPAESAGWHDCVWFNFDELAGTLDEMKLSKHKVMSLYLVDEKQFFRAGSFEIEHYDWAYHHPLGAFIPTRYKVTIETETGVLEMAANIVGCYVWGATGEVPDQATTTLHWDKLEGIFSYKDGRKRTLTDGLGGSIIRQWIPYPNTLTPSFSGAGVPEVARKATV